VIDRAAELPYLDTYNGMPAIMLLIQRQPSANVVDTVSRINTASPRFQASSPPSVDIQIVTDRTRTIRASVNNEQITLILTNGVVVALIFLFFGDVRATVISGITVPLSLIGTFAMMYRPAVLRARRRGEHRNSAVDRQFARPHAYGVRSNIGHGMFRQVRIGRIGMLLPSPTLHVPVADIVRAGVRDRTATGSRPALDRLRSVGREHRHRVRNPDAWRRSLRASPPPPPAQPEGPEPPRSD
jgi:AcrB/AcrD/AcrF family